MRPPYSDLGGGESAGSEKHFFERAGEDLCEGCSAPCCRAFFLPYPIPTTYMDLDAMLYLLGFPTTQMILTSDGNWKVMIEGSCRFFDLETNLCTIYATTRRPKTCVYFNPYQCWHKRNFHDNENLSDIVRIDVAALEAILDHVRFDDDGDIIEIPEWEVLQELANNHKLNDPLVSVQPDVVDIGKGTAPDD